MSEQILANRYFLHTRLGSGKHGTVTLAHDCRTNTSVAIKAPITPQEYDLLESTRHAHVPACYERLWLDEQTGALVMEYIEGETLRDYLAGLGTLPLWETHQIVATLSTILFSLETQPRPIAYHDLHAANVVRRSCDGRLYLVDFGHASFLVEGQEPPASGVWLRHFVEYELLPYVPRGTMSQALSAWCRELRVDSTSTRTVGAFYQQWLRMLESEPLVWSMPSSSVRSLQIR